MLERIAEQLNQRMYRNKKLVDQRRNDHNIFPKSKKNVRRASYESCPGLNFKTFVVKVATRNKEVPQFNMLTIGTKDIQVRESLPYSVCKIDVRIPFWRIYNTSF